VSGFLSILFVVEFTVTVKLSYLTARFIFKLCVRTRTVFFVLFAPLAFSFGNRVVAPRAERIAAEYTPYGKPESNEKPPFFKCLDGIGRACRRKPAARASFKWRNKFLV